MGCVLGRTQTYGIITERVDEENDMQERTSSEMTVKKRRTTHLPALESKASLEGQEFKEELS